VVVTRRGADGTHEPVAIVAGSKVSTKLLVLQSLARNVDRLIVGGGIANTFLLAEGLAVGKSLAEPALVDEARAVIAAMRARGADVELIDAKAIGLPMLDRMYKEHPKGAAPAPLEKLAGQIRDADGFVFVTGEYNWGMQPGLKNLTDHFLEEWFWRPAAIASYSSGRLSGVRSGTTWHGTLSEMGMVVVSSTIAVGAISETLSADGEPMGEAGAALEQAFPRFADDLAWWTAAAKAQRAVKAPPY